MVVRRSRHANTHGSTEGKRARPDSLRATDPPRPLCEALSRQTHRDWLAAATRVLNENPPVPGLERTTTKLRTPPGKSATTARKLASLPDSYPAISGLPRIITVHQVKGDAAKAVLVLLPKSKRGKGLEGNSNASAAMEEWLGGETSPVKPYVRTVWQLPAPDAYSAWLCQPSSNPERPNSQRHRSAGARTLNSTSMFPGVALCRAATRVQTGTGKH